MKTLLAGAALMAATVAATSAQPAKPTIVLVHGAFADSSSWDGVVEILETAGHPVMSIANPLRGVKRDADYVADALTHIGSPVVLVGHSYGGAVISDAAAGNRLVKALVYVAAFAPERGETASALSTKFPGSTLGPALDRPVTLSTGGTDLYIQPRKFHEQFAADVTASRASLMAAAQRPIAEAALNEPQVGTAWKDIPAWFIYGDRDRNIPAEVLAFMAERAHARETVVVKGASHVVMISNPEPVAQLIQKAATEASRSR